MATITITLHDGDVSTQRITVAVKDPIQILHDHITPGGRRLIIHRGSVIMTGFSFQHHGVQDGDELHVIRRRGPPSQRSARWAAEMRHSNALLREAARLSDLWQRIRGVAVGDTDDIGHATVPLIYKTVLDGGADNASTDPLPA
jgi:hypothetical protein